MYHHFLVDSSDLLNKAYCPDLLHYSGKIEEHQESTKHNKVQSLNIILGICCTHSIQICNVPPDFVADNRATVLECDFNLPKDNKVINFITGLVGIDVPNWSMFYKWIRILKWYPKITDDISSLICQEILCSTFVCELDFPKTVYIHICYLGQTTVMNNVH